MSATGQGAPARSATADREIVISRVIDAPRELVFEAFTEVRHLSRWWGPEGFSTTTRSFTFREGGFDGPRKEYHPKGFVEPDGSNAVWGMQFVWPIKAEYLIVSLDEGYTQTVIARNRRDYVWLMARTPTIPEADYERFVRQIASWGYDVEKLRRVPQRW